MTTLIADPFPHQPTIHTANPDRVAGSVDCVCGWSNNKRTRNSQSPRVWRNHAREAGMSEADIVASEAAYVERLFR